MAEQPVRFGGIVPYLFYADAAAALAWLSRVFGFVEIARHPDEAGRVGNAEMKAGEHEVWLDGGMAKKPQGEGTWIGVWVDDVDAMAARVEAAGVAVKGPEDKPYGVRMCQVTDPEGYTWGFMRRI